MVWFFTSKVIKKFFTALYADENVLYLNEDSGDAVFSYIEMGINYIDLNNSNLDNNFDEDDPDTIIHIRLLAWHIRFEKRRELKKKISEELMSVAWPLNRRWNFCVSQDEKKECFFMYLI